MPSQSQISPGHDRPPSGEPRTDDRTARSPGTTDRTEADAGDRERSLLTTIVDSIEHPNAQGVAAAVGRLISSGELAEGQRLPTVRAIARELGVSPTTISDAWQILGRGRAIDTRGRQGTFVGNHEGTSRRQRFWQIYPSELEAGLDLSEGVPDPELLPSLGPILAGFKDQPFTSSYLDDPVLPPLRELLQSRWPFPPEAVTVVNGALDALDRICATNLRVGDRAVVEDPGFPPLFDLLEAHGVEPVGVPMDAEGIRPSELERALDRRVQVVFLQPRSHNPTGVDMSSRRRDELASLLGGTGILVVEDDHSGDLSIGEPVSIGELLPASTVRIQSFSKSHGPDLRLAAVGGARQPIAEMVTRRRLGSSWTSRLLQQLLLEMLRDDSIAEQVTRAGETYRERRRLVTEVLDRHGVGYTGHTGLNLWVEVDDERSALVALAAQGIGVAPGSPFQLSRSERTAHPHIRVTTGVLTRDHEEIAAQIVRAARPLPARTAV